MKYSDFVVVSLFLWGLALLLMATEVFLDGFLKFRHVTAKLLLVLGKTLDCRQRLSLVSCVRGSIDVLSDV